MKNDAVINALTPGFDGGKKKVELTLWDNPFDQVQIEKYIDNALLNSVRTTKGLNNTLS